MFDRDDVLMVFALATVLAVCVFGYASCETSEAQRPERVQCLKVNNSMCVGHGEDYESCLIKLCGGPK